MPRNPYRTYSPSPIYRLKPAAQPDSTSTGADGAAAAADRPGTASTPLAEAWATFARLQLPADLPDDARLMLRRCFYAGAYSLDTLLKGCCAMDAGEADHCQDVIEGEITMFAATFGSTLEGRV